MDELNEKLSKLFEFMNENRNMTTDPKVVETGLFLLMAACMGLIKENQELKAWKDTVLTVAIADSKIKNVIIPFAESIGKDIDGMNSNLSQKMKGLADVLKELNDTVNTLKGNQ